MKQNLLFNQASALGKRLAMVLTMLIIVGIGQAWGAEATATLSFADKAQRTSFSTIQQVWTQNGVTFTNNKASSTNDVANYSNPVRLYANSEVIVEHTSGKITEIVFDCNSSSYATAMNNSIGTVSGATVSVSSDQVTVTFTTAVESFTVAKLTAQIRLDAITVTYEVAVTEYTITYTGDDHITYSGTKPETITTDAQGFELEFSVDDGYQLNDVQVKMGGQNLVFDDEYYWEEGYILIVPETEITGDIEIIFETVATCTAPTITTQPSAATYTKGATATALKVVASGENLTYQWYSNTSNSTSGATKINDATNSTYTPSTSTVGTKYYYCIVSSGSCPTTSNIVSVVVKNPPFTVTLNAGSGSCAASVTESSSGAGVELPTPTLTGCDEWTFAGWATASVGTETTTKPTLIAAGTYKPTSNITLYAVYQRTKTTEGVETTTITTDKLTRETTGVTSGSTTYTDWSDKTVTSKAVYAGNSAGSNNSIQLRSKNSNSGVITTKSGGKAKKVTVVWQSSTSSGRTLDIYGKNSAYSAATELYSTSTQGTKLGSIVKGTSTTLTITGDYEYIGLRSNSDAMYLTSISIDWATTTAGGTTITTYYHSTPECSTETLVSLDPNGGTFASTPDGWTKDGNNYVITHTGTEITLPTNISQEGKIFGGWYDGETAYKTIPADLSESITLTAKWSDKQDPEIAWEPETCTVTIDAGGQLPIFKNPNNLTPITFESSNSEVASVDNNGVITLGTTATTATVTITATFAGDATYAAKKATCTLTVHPSNCRWVETEIGDIKSYDEVVVTMTNGVTTWALDQELYNGGDKYPIAQELTIVGTEIREELNANNLKWNISGNESDGYILYPNGQTSTWLYCTGSSNTIKIGDGSPKLFIIENGYLKSKSKVTTSGVEVDAYLGVSPSTKSWRHYPNTTTSVIAGQTLKFYKRECLDASKVWVEGNLTNVTCDTQLPQQLAKDGYITLTFEAVDGYALPNNVTVSNATMTWDQATGILTISNPTGNVMVTVAADKQHTITWHIAGDETLKTYVVDGNRVELPDLDNDPTSCSDTYTTFVGWYTEPSGMETSPSAEPQGEQVTASTVPTDNTTYYAVWADGSGAGEEQISETLDFSTNSWDFPTVYTTTEQTYTNGTYSIILKGTGSDGYKYNSNQILLGKSDAYMKLPAFPFKVSKIVASKPEGTVSGRVTWNVYSGDNEVSTAVTGCTNGGTFEIADNNQTAGTVYTIKVTNANNLQIKSLDIYSLVAAATGYISSCCQSQAVVTVTPENDNLELDIEGTASTTVNISQTGSTSGGEFSADVTGSATLVATNNATDNPYKLTFTATEKGEYSINSTFTDTEFECPKYGTATITVAANPILLASADELIFSPTCGQSSASQEVEINSRYLTSNSITATVATTSGSGKFTISTDNTTFGTSKTLSGGIATKVTDQIYVRYEAEEGETGAVAGTLTLECGSTQKVINLTGTCTCSANVTITGGPIQITAAKDVWVEAATELTITGTFLTTNADNANVSIRAYTNNAAFQIKNGGVTGEGAPKTASNNALTLNTNGAISTADWTGNIAVVYKPTQANTTETATLTVEVYRHNASTIYSTATYELEGRSLPEQFVIAVTNGSGDWFAVPADMIAPWGESCSGLGTFAPYPITVDNTATIASDVPARAIYQAAARTGNVNTNPQTMSYKSVPLGGNYYLYGSSTNVDSDGNNTNIQNASFAASEKQKWFLDVVDWNTKQYNMHVHSSLTTNVLAYTTASGANRVGQYSATAGSTKKAVYLLPINGTTCTYYAAPVVTVMAIDATNATIQFKNDRTTAYEISLDQNTWTDLPVTLIKDCNNSEEATLLEAQLPLATYRGKTVYIRAKVTTGTACQETGKFVVPNPTIDRGETPWNFTGTAGQAFRDNSKSITISDLWNPLSVSVVQQVTGSNIQASITPEGVVTVSMAAEDATEGDHKAVLEFTSAGAETKQVGVVITLHSLALQEFDGGDYNTFWEGILCKDLIDFSGGTPTIYLSYQLYLNGTPISTTVQLNQTAFSLVDLVTGEPLTILRDGNTGGGVAFVTIPTASVAKMVPGHTYRLSWENTNQVMTDKNGLPYMDCYMDFVYSENCDAPTALPACPITNSGFTANWAPVADCTGDVTVDVYTRGGHSVLVNKTTFTDVKDLKSAITSENVWITNVNNDNEGAPSTTANGLLISDVSTPKYYNLFSPLLSKLGTIDESVIYTITVVLYQQTVDAGAGAYFYVMDNGSSLTKNTTPNIEDKTITIDDQTATYKKLTSGTTTFTVKGLSSDDRIRFLGFETGSIASNKKNVYISSITIEASGSITPIASKTVACNAGSAEFTGLSANTTYYYTVGDGNGNNSNEIAVTTYSGAPSLKYYSDEACTTEITETKVLGGEETTVYVKGTNISACKLVPSVTTGYAYDDSGLSYKPSTGDVSGKIILTVTDPANTISGTLTIAGFPLDLISSDCPAGFNNMANDATNVTSNSAQANWNRGLNFGDDPSGTLLLYENGEVFVELVENGDFETGSLNDGWSSSIHTGPSDGNKAFNDYELVNDNDEYSLYIKEDANCGTLANFHDMTLMYANYVTLKPGTYRMKAQVKVPEVSGYKDKEKIFAIGLVQSGLSVIAVSPEKTVLSNNTYVEIIYEFELANEMTVCPAIGARQAAGDFRKFYIDNVSLMRIKCPGPGDLIREIPITDLGTGFEDIEGLKPNTEYTYVIKNVNDCESNEITFYTGQGNYMPMQVVEWKENSVVVMYTGSETNAIVMIGSNTPKTVALTQQDVAIYELPITGLIEHPTEKLYITIGEGFKAVTIPYIISTTKDEDDLTTNRDLARTSDIVILNEGKLNITKTGNAAYQFHDITIYGGGKMIVEGEVKIASLTMRIGAVVNRAHQALYPQLVLKGQITNSSRQINLDYITTYDRYFALSVPYPVLTESIHYPADIYGDNLTTGNKASFALQWYNGEARASETRKGWEDLPEPATLAPYKGYTFWGAPRKVNGVRPTFGIHRIPMPVEDVTIKRNETTDKQINVYAHPAANAYDAGWNFLGNPYLAQYGNMEEGHTSGLLGMLTQNAETGVWEHTSDYRYITITEDGKTYIPIPVTDATFYPFNTFFVQARENGAVSFYASKRISLPARHYAAQQEAAKEITTGIILTGNDQTDRTGLLIADNFTEEYDFNADLSKFENSGINLYTIGKDGKLAYMAINQTLAEQPIPLGYSAPTDGEYTIAFDEDRYNATDISALYLIDYDRNETTNLLHTDYSFVTAAGTNNERFALQVAFIPQNATSVEWVDDATIQVAVDGNNLLLNNLPTDAGVQVFDALGRVIYATPNAPTEMQITLPTGYYLVRIADKQHAVVINTVIP